MSWRMRRVRRFKAPVDRSQSLWMEGLEEKMTERVQGCDETESNWEGGSEGEERRRKKARSKKVGEEEVEDGGGKI